MINETDPFTIPEDLTDEWFRSPIFPNIGNDDLFKSFQFFDDPETNSPLVTTDTFPSNSNEMNESSQRGEIIDNPMDSKTNDIYDMSIKKKTKENKTTTTLGMKKTIKNLIPLTDIDSDKLFVKKVRFELKKWLLENLDNPYPTQHEKEYFAKQYNMSLKQINTFFVNERRRFLKRAVKKNPIKRVSINGLNCFLSYI